MRLPYQKDLNLGSDMIKDLIFEVINEEQLDEKLIVYNNRKPYGQIVFLAGGAGSGKGFAGSHFIDSADFKVRDVDEMKKQLQILNRMDKISIDQIIKNMVRTLNLKIWKISEQYNLKDLILEL